MSDKGPPHHRRSIRLRRYDYTQAGAYFVTICTYNRELLFGEIVDGEMRLNEWGEIAWAEWFQTAVVRPNVTLYPDEFVVMPNHVHGIIRIVDDIATNVGAQRCAPAAVGAQRRCAPTAAGPRVLPGSLGAIIRAYKSATTRRINEHRGTPGAPLWQRNYYEHIIRDQTGLDRIRAYILSNPTRWPADTENPGRIKT